ncbi:hypothetical protein [Brasilonema sp. UFV-L1]|uniref:hypothetical protein n=1 Tax=Brasilonema sp. UFV-L1 TaxID=2234130 RepID=UPI00145E1DD2|nr:hypothetical protein [Brasilonema sp. UFV-L1]NMG11610.1 hypothetical protein [Brasilonema sp. UFV-L1]
MIDSQEQKPSYPKPYKPKRQEASPQPCQHVKILDCNKPISRVFFECYHCRQGLLTECKGDSAVQEFKVPCPTCGKTAIYLMTSEIISTTAIPSPWDR